MLKLKGETFVVGDIHGDPVDLIRNQIYIEDYPKQIKHIFLLGDIGFGFVRGRYRKRLSNIISVLDSIKSLDDVSDDDKFIREFLYCVTNSAKDLVLSIMYVARLLTGNKDVQVYAIRGNHDNPDFWNKKTKLGKAVSKVDKNFHFLNDGFIEINNELWLTIGGAVSVDRFTADRIEGISWWAGEEMDGSFNEPLPIGYKKLTGILSHTGKVPSYADYKLPVSHTGMVREALEREEKAIDSLLFRYNPSSWFYGHFHYPWAVVLPGVKFTCVGEHEMIPLPRCHCRKHQNRPRNRF